MRDYQSKSNLGGGADSITPTKFGGGEFNSLATENKTAVERSGLTLAPANGTGEVTTQLGQSLLINALKGQTFQAGGTGNAITLTPVSGASGVVVPANYDPLDGARVVFRPSASNTGNVTASIGQTSGTQLGAKKVLDINGSELSTNDFTTSDHVQLIYDASADSSNGAWIVQTGGAGGGGTGDVTGPASSTNENIAVFDGTTGKVIKDGGLTVAEIQGIVGASQYVELDTIFSTTQQIPADGTVPLVTEGAEFLSTSIDVDDAAQVVNCSLNVPISSFTVAGQGYSVAVFRGATCIATGASARAAAFGVDAGIAIMVQDSPGVGTHTYSARIGGAVAGTVRINADFDGVSLYGSTSRATITLLRLDA